MAAEWFAARAPRSLDGYQRLADTLARAGRDAEATQVIRTGWAEAPADPVAETAFLTRNAALLTPAEHGRRFDRLALAREGAAAARVMPYLDPARQGNAAARLAYAADRPDADAPGPRRDRAQRRRIDPGARALAPPPRSGPGRRRRLHRRCAVDPPARP
ncbi:hypothetical protein [Dankookia sp. P2]|uniref:hypothetical protein n=1 Tax=Dankookia sp. P2 TaxID=3423955 RepID=UPI003D6644D3